MAESYAYITILLQCKLESECNVVVFQDRMIVVEDCQRLPSVDQKRVASA